jgi:hypothetical protein
VPKLVQLGIFGLCSNEDREVGVGVLPQREKILIGRFGFGGVALLFTLGFSCARIQEFAQHRMNAQPRIYAQDNVFPFRGAFRFDLDSSEWCANSGAA